MGEYHPSVLCNILAVLCLHSRIVVMESRFRFAVSAWSSALSLHRKTSLSLCNYYSVVVMVWNNPLQHQPQ